MGYRLHMSAEFHDWLAELRDSDPSAAVLAAQALAALAAEGDHLGPPLVAVVPGRLEPDQLLAALDRRYQAWLGSLQVLRRQVSDAMTLRRSLERRLAETTAPDDDLVAAREQLAAATESGDRLAAVSQREQLQADAFRTRMEVLKALYSAARAEQFIEQAQADGDAENAGDDEATAAAARIDEITGQIEQEVGWEEPAEGLLELRPREPGRLTDPGLRILFAVEPPGTALLVAVLDGHEAVRDHYREAVLLASEVLREAQAGQAAEAAEHTFADARSFLEEFFPGRADELAAGAAALVAVNRAQTLAEQRARLGLTQAQVAARMGVRQERVSAIERADPRAAEVRTLAAYVEALGGRLDIIADFGSERVPLR